MEKSRGKLRRLVEKNVPYDSPQMRTALSEFEAADEKWKRLEREYLQYKEQLDMGNDIY